jgi:hypothetical protein
MLAGNHRRRGTESFGFLRSVLQHKVGPVKADGKDILAVAMALRGNAGMGLDRLS